MSKRPLSPRGSGITGLLWVFCLTGLIAGLGFDLGAGARVRFWIGDQPAAATAMGLAAVVFAILAMHVARAVLAKRTHGRTRGGDADLHP